MVDYPEHAGDKKLVLTAKDKFLQRISGVTDLTVPPVILDQIFPVLTDEKLPKNFGTSRLMHDPSIVAYFLKKLYEDPDNSETLYSGMDKIFKDLGKEEMYALLSEMTPMENFDEVAIEEWKHAYSSHLLMYAIITENEFTQLLYLVPLMLVHDIGKQVLHQVAPDTSKDIVNLCRQKMLPRSMAEMDFLRLTHADAGARLLKEWHFPPRFYKPILYHHSTTIPEEYVLETALIQFVNWVDCSVRGIPAAPLKRATMAAAGIEEIDTEYWVNRHKEIVAEINGYFEPEGIMNKKQN